MRFNRCVTFCLFIPILLALVSCKGIKTSKDAGGISDRSASTLECTVKTDSATDFAANIPTEEFNPWIETFSLRNFVLGTAGYVQGFVWEGPRDMFAPLVSEAAALAQDDLKARLIVWTLVLKSDEVPTLESLKQIAAQTDFESIGFKLLQVGLRDGREGYVQIATQMPDGIHEAIEQEKLNAEANLGSAQGIGNLTFDACLFAPMLFTGVTAVGKAFSGVQKVLSGAVKFEAVMTPAALVLRPDGTAVLKPSLAIALSVDSVAIESAAASCRVVSGPMAGALVMCAATGGPQLGLDFGSGTSTGMQIKGGSALSPKDIPEAAFAAAESLPNGFKNPRFQKFFADHPQLRWALRESPPGPGDVVAVAEGLDREGWGWKLIFKSTRVADEAGGLNMQSPSVHIQAAIPLEMEPERGLTLFVDRLRFAGAELASHAEVMPEELPILVGRKISVTAVEVGNKARIPNVVDMTTEVKPRTFDLISELMGELATP